MIPQHRTGDPIRFLSLFAGIGGFDLGLERAGWTCVGQVEIDQFCQRVLAKHWPNVKRMGDIREVQGNEFGELDAIVGGFPCQNVSNAGDRNGIDGEQSGLWNEYLRLVRTIRPRYVVVENVAALLVRGIDRVLGDLAAIGYDAEWQVLSASSFGAPHLRERVFIIAYPGGIGMAGPFQSEKSSQGRSWWAGSEADLLAVIQHPRRESNRVPKPLLCRMDDGTAYWVDRLAACGNAVVPQVAEYIGNAIQRGRYDNTTISNH